MRSFLFRNIPQVVLRNTPGFYPDALMPLQNSMKVPPLDTVIGSERPTVQLLDIRLENGRYSFYFSRLGREKSLEVIHSGIGHTLTMENYPRSSEWIIELRQRINSLISVKY